jgi:hypothetical protein
LLAAHQSFGIGIASIHQMDVRQEIALCSRLMHSLKHLIIWNGGLGRLDMRDQMWQIFITGLG